MLKYKYKARDNSGNLKTGEVEATDETTAAGLIRKRNLYPISIKPAQGGLLGFLKIGDSLSGKTVTGLTRQLATMIAAGLPITQALIVLRNQNSNQTLQRILAQIHADVEGGESLSTAMSKHPKSFNNTYIALVKSGELGGVLDKVLVRLADNLEKDQEFKSKVKAAMIYPIIIILGMVAVSFIMITFVIPKMTELYDEFDAELPLPTKLLLGFSEAFNNLWPVFIVIGVGLVVFLLWYKETPTGKRKIDSLVLNIPIFGDLQRQIILTEITRTLSLMIGSGVSILDGINITSQSVKNSIIADALADVGKDIERGFPVSYTFTRHTDAFPFILGQMVSVGEETGKMDEVLGKVSHVFEVESEQRLKAATNAIEPLIMIVLGVGVAFLVIAVILPIYNLTSSF